MSRLTDVNTRCAAHPAPRPSRRTLAVTRTWVVDSRTAPEAPPAGPTSSVRVQRPGRRARKARAAGTRQATAPSPRTTTAAPQEHDGVERRDIEQHASMNRAVASDTTRPTDRPAATGRSPCSAHVATMRPRVAPRVKPDRELAPAADGPLGHRAEDPEADERESRDGEGDRHQQQESPDGYACREHFVEHPQVADGKKRIQPADRPLSHPGDISRDLRGATVGPASGSERVLSTSSVARATVRRMQNSTPKRRHRLAPYLFWFSTVWNLVVFPSDVRGARKTWSLLPGWIRSMDDTTILVISAIFATLGVVSGLIWLEGRWDARVLRRRLAGAKNDIAFALEEADPVMFEVKVRDLYPGLRRDLGVFTPSTESAPRAGDARRDWLEDHRIYMKLLQREIHNGTFVPERWNRDVASRAALEPRRHRHRGVPSRGHFKRLPGPAACRVESLQAGDDDGDGGFGQGPWATQNGVRRVGDRHADREETR